MNTDGGKEGRTPNFEPSNLELRTEQRQGFLQTRFAERGNFILTLLHPLVAGEHRRPRQHRGAKGIEQEITETTERTDLIWCLP